MLELPVADRIEQPVNNLNNELVYALRKHMYQFHRADEQLSKLGMANNLRSRDKRPKPQQTQPPKRPPAAGSSRTAGAPAASTDAAAAPAACRSGVASAAEATTGAADAAVREEATPVAAPCGVPTDREGNAAAAPDCCGKASAGAPAHVEVEGDENIGSVCFL